MTEFTMDEGVVLIIPGYTEQEQLEMYGYGDGTSSSSKDTSESTESDSDSESITYISKKKDSSTSKSVKTTTTSKKTTAKNNKTSTKKSTNTSATKYEDKSLNNKVVKEIEKPPAMYFRCKSVDFTPHIKDYEEFSSAEGLILIEKACDRYAEVQLEVLVHQKLSTLSGSFTSGNDKYKVNVYTEDFTQNQIEGGFEVWEVPKDLKDNFIELRRSFFTQLSGRPLTVISPLTQNIAVGYMTECDYNIGEGEAESTWNITIREVDNTWV